MKIGLFTDGYFPQIHGVSVSVDNSAKGLRLNKNNEVYVVAAKYPKIKKEKYVIRLNSISLIKDMNVRVATHIPDKAFFELSKIDFDIIHGHAGGPISLLGYELAKIKRIPYIFTYHTLFNQYTHYFLKGKIITPKMAETASRILCNRFDYIVAPTQRIKDELISYGVNKPIEVVPSGIDVKKFDISQTGFLRKKIGIRDDQKIVLYVGRLAKEKSIDFLLHSFKIIADKDKSCVLVLVGHGKSNDVKYFKSLVKELDLEKNVYFTGAFGQDEIAKAYVDGYVFVFASDSETQGMVVLEALAAGVPVIAVKDKALEGTVVDGENGILTNRDYNDFANEVVAFLNNQSLRDQMSVKSKQSVQRFSIEKHAQDLEKLYEKVLASRKMNRMHEVIVDSEIDLPVSRVWQLLTDPDYYPKYVKFVKKVYGPKEFCVGTEWKDLTTILWVPGKVIHRVTVLDKNKLLGFDVPMPFPLNGTMIQRVYFEENGTKTKFNASIKFKFNNLLIDVLVTPILKRRLKEMMMYTVERAREDREKLLS